MISRMKSVNKADKSYLLLFMRSLDGLLPNRLRETLNDWLHKRSAALGGGRKFDCHLICLIFLCPIRLVSHLARRIFSVPFTRPLKNYLRCRCGVKNRLEMLIYYAKTSIFCLFLPCIGCLENVFQRPVTGCSTYRIQPDAWWCAIKQLHPS